MALKNKPARFPLFQKFVVAMFWYGVMYIGLHSITGFIIGFQAGFHGTPATAGHLGQVAAVSYSHKSNPMLMGAAFALTVAMVKSYVSAVRSQRKSAAKTRVTPK